MDENIYFKIEVVKAIGKLYSHNVYTEQQLANELNLSQPQISNILKCYGYVNGKLVQRTIRNYNNVKFLDNISDKFAILKKCQVLNDHAYNIKKYNFYY